MQVFIVIVQRYLGHIGGVVSVPKISIRRGRHRKIEGTESQGNLPCCANYHINFMFLVLFVDEAVMNDFFNPPRIDNHFVSSQRLQKS